MVTNSIVSFVLFLFAPFVNSLPDIDVSSALNSQEAETFLEWVNLAGYMFPFRTLAAMVAILLALFALRCVISFFKNLWGVLPFL